MMGYVSASSLLGMAVAFMNIGTILVICRVFIRHMQKMRQGVDDFFLVPALVLMIAMCINMITGVAYGRMGVSVSPRVDADGTIDQSYGWSQAAAQHEKFVYAHEVIFPLQLMCAKLSILFFYRRVLCPDTRGSFHRATVITIILTVVWGFVFFLCFLFECGSDFYLIWDGPMYIAGLECLGLRIEAGLAISDFLLDVVILLLPIRRIFTLHMPLGKKFLVAAAFMLAGLTVTASFVRAVVLENVMMGVTSDFTGTDEAMVNSTACYWGLLESGLSVIVACLPSLQYLLVVALPRRIAKSFGDSSCSKSDRAGRPVPTPGSSASGAGKRANGKVKRWDDLDDTMDSHDLELLGGKEVQQASLV